MGVLPKANPTAQAKLKLAQAVFDDVGGYDELTPHRAQELLNDIFPDETFDLPEDGAGAKHGALSGGGRFITVAYTYLQALLGQAPDSPPKAPRPPEAPKQQGPLSALFSSLTSVIPSAPRPLSPPGPQLPIADEAQGTDSDVSQTGLKNLINTCYANGALQGLAGCEEFMRLARTELETLPDATSPKQRTLYLLFELLVGLQARRGTTPDTFEEPHLFSSRLASKDQELPSQSSAMSRCPAGCSR